MTRFTLEAVLLGTDPTAWVVERYHPALQSILAQVLTLERLEVVETTQRGSTTYITTVTAPHAGSWVPSAAAKHLPGGGDAVELFETIAMDEKLALGPPFEMHITTEIPALAGTASIHSKMVIEDAGDGATRQTLHAEVKVRLALGLGKWAEKLVKKSMQDAYERLPEVAARWAVARRALGPARLAEGLPFSVATSPWIPPVVKEALSHVPPPPGTPVQAMERQLTRYFSAFEALPDQIDAILEDSGAAGPSPSLNKTESTARQSLERLETVARWSRGLGLLPPPPVVAEPLESSSRPPGPRKKRGIVQKALDLVCWTPGGK